MNIKFVDTMSRRNFVKVAGATGLAATLAACGGGAEEPAAEGEGTEEPAAEGEGSAEPAAEAGGVTYTIGIPTAPASLDPIVAGDGVSMQIISNCIEGLFVKDDNAQIQPGMCESYEVDDENVTWTFHLRDQNWSNGDPVTSHDFLYAWQRSALGDNGGVDFQYQLSLCSFTNVDAVIAGEKDVSELGVECPDDKTIVCHLDHPVAFLLDLFAFTPFAPIQQKYREEKGDQFALSQDDMLYNGPYILTQWDTAGSQIVMTKNPDYWDAANVQIDTVIEQVITDTQQAIMNYQSGTVDYIELTGDLVQQYENEEGFKANPGIWVYYLMMNTERPGMDTTDFQKAIAYGIDRPDICDNILKDGSTPAYQLTMVGLATNEAGEDFATVSDQYYEFDEATAKEYWAKAIEETDARSFTILYDEEKEFAKTTCSYIKDKLEKMLEGLTINLESTPKKNRIDREGQGDFDVIFHGWGPDYADPTAILAMYNSDDPSNYSRWSNEEFDNLYREANTTLAGDAAARWDNLLRCNSIATDLSGCIPLYQSGAATITRPGVEGMTAHLTGVGCFFKFVTKA
ncbi:MAG: peptide ABC transporter substrate-binding protein [Atopobiaceae bacterium]|nr:peptide ABC transporter substrate-binding protein [Atopobiaceae bacterium]